MQHAAQHAITVGTHFVLLKPVTRCRATLEIETDADLGLVAACPYVVTLCAIASDQFYGIEHDRFSGAGFTRQCAHARVKFELQGIDNGEISDLDRIKH